MAKQGFRSKLRGISKGVLGAFAGGWRQFYEGADFYSPERTYIDPTIRDADDQLDTWSRETLFGLAMSLYGNVGFVKGAVDDVARYSVGCGILPLSYCSDKTIAAEYDNYWEQWCRIPEVTGRFNFATVQKLTSKSLDVGGDLGFILTTTDTGYPQIQAHEAHRICSKEDTESDRDGVTINKYGRPTAYTVKIKGQKEDFFRKIDADSFIHVFEPERFDGRRSGSGLKHGINHIRDKKDILAFEKLGVKNVSSIGVVVTTNGTTSDGFFGKQSKEGDLTLERIRGGAIPRLQTGESIETVKSDRPSSTFLGFLDYIDRDVAVGLGVPVEFVWNSSALGGTSQRFVLEKAQRRFEERQQTLVRMIDRVWRHVIIQGISRGDIPDAADYFRVYYQMPSKITVDVGKDAKANREDVNAGLRTAQEDYGERGKSFIRAREDIEAATVDKLERATRIWQAHKDKGLTFQEAIELIESKSNGGSAPAPQKQSGTDNKAEK